MEIEPASALALLDSVPKRPAGGSQSPRRRASSTLRNGKTARSATASDAGSGGCILSLNEERTPLDQSMSTGVVWSQSGEAAPAAVRRPSAFRAFVDRWLWGIVAVLCSMLLGGLGLTLLYGGFSPNTGRFFLSAGLYGIAGAASNYVATRFLLHNVFIGRNERAFKRSIRGIVMDLFFDEETIESELVHRVRQAASTGQLKRQLHSVLESVAFEDVLDRRLATLATGPEGIMLALLGIEIASLKPLVRPAVLSIAADLTPIIEQSLMPERIISADRLADALHAVVSARIEAFSLAEVGAVVRKVLTPHLSVMILWGSAFCWILGVVSELVQVSRFIHTQSRS